MVSYDVASTIHQSLLEGASLDDADFELDQDDIF
jgi:hypothetical protein